VPVNSAGYTPGAGSVLSFDELQVRGWRVIGGHQRATRRGRCDGRARCARSRVRSRLSAGGRWIRTFGSPTDPLPFREQSASHDGLTVSRPGIESSNPPPSSRQSVSRPHPLSKIEKPGFPRGCPRLAWRPGRQRRAACFDIAPTGGNISVGPYSSTAGPLMGLARMPRRSQRTRGSGLNVK
jgi:hypothetical protein